MEEGGGGGGFKVKNINGKNGHPLTYEWMLGQRQLLYLIILIIDVSRNAMHVYGRELG